MVNPASYYKKNKPVEVEVLREDFVRKIAKGDLSVEECCRLFDMVKYVCRDDEKEHSDGRSDRVKGYDYAYRFTYGHWPWERPEEKEEANVSFVFLCIESEG